MYSAFERSHVLELVLEGVHEALDVCHRHEYLKEALERQKFDIQVVTYDKSVELNAIVADIEAAHLSFVNLGVNANTWRSKKRHLCK